jgi:hypothetical protein
MKRTKLIGIIIGTLVMTTIGIGAVSTKLTTVSFGLWGEIEPRHTIIGFYDRSITVYSGEDYYLQINPDNNTFTGWFIATNGKRYDGSGTFIIEGNQISGTWQLDIGYSGWITGHIGVR